MCMKQGERYASTHNHTLWIFIFDIVSFPVLMQALGTRFILFITETEENTLFLVNKTNGNIGILVHWKIGCYILVWVVSCMFDIKELTCY